MNFSGYVFTDWYFGQVPVSLRYGKQVLSWGESTFIQGGINIINPIDVPAFRAPGSEIKDALLPVEMFYMSAGVTESLTVEAFVQNDWEPVRPDNCGTFFSTNDFAAEDCGPVLLAGQLPDSQALAQGLVADRVGDRQADTKDQFGVAMRWFLPQLNESELGFYYIKYNSRLPYVSGIVRDPNNGQNLPLYFIEYPENINLYGVSINTITPGGWSLGAEYSYRDKLPLQWNAFELLFGGNEVVNPETGLPASQLQVMREAQAGGQSLNGEAVQGYDEYGVSQAQFTLIKFIETVMGADRLTIVTEFGATYVHDLPDYDTARYGRSGTFGIGQLPGGACEGSGQTGQALNINTNYCNNEGFTTDFSWGYRARFVWSYLDAFAGINLLPQLAWSHDVKGYSPQPGGAFNEGSKAIGLSVEAVYQNVISADIGYTNYFDGRPYNELTDRDYVTASISYSF